MESKNTVFKIEKNNAACFIAAETKEEAILLAQDSFSDQSIQEEDILLPQRKELDEVRFFLDQEGLEKKATLRNMLKEKKKGVLWTEAPHRTPKVIPSLKEVVLHLWHEGLNDRGEFGDLTLMRKVSELLEFKNNTARFDWAVGSEAVVTTITQNPDGTYHIEDISIKDQASFWLKMHS